MAVEGERHAERNEMVKFEKRKRGLDQRQVAVHAAAGEKATRHGARGIARVAGRVEPVVGLFVRARVRGDARAHAPGEYRDILHAQAPQVHRGVQRGGARTDDGRPHGYEGDVDARYAYTRLFHVRNIVLPDRIP